MSRYRTTMKELLEKVYKEDGHQDVSSSKRMCKTIVEDAQQIEAKLNSMSPEDSLDTWWTNKLAVSANNLNKARDYIVNDIKEAKIISDISGISIPKLKKEAQPFNVKVDRVTPGGFDAEYEVTFSGSEQSLIKYAKKHLGFDGNNFGQLKRHLAMEELDMTNEEVEIEEGKMKTIATMFDQGKSADEIAKALKLPVSTVKSILGEETELDEFTTDQIKLLKKSYGGMRGKTIAPQKANMLSKHLDRLDLLSLRQLVKEKIPFLSTLARNKIYRKTGKFEEVELEEQTMRQKAVMIAKKMAGNMTDAVKEIEKLMKGLSKDPVVATTLKRVNEDYLKETDITKDNVQKGDSEKEKELKIKLDKEKDQDALEKQLIAAQGQINILKQKLENEKNKALKPEPNRETGEVPLTVGVAYKHFKDKAKKEVKEDLEEATKNTDFKVKMKTPSGMKMVRVTVPIKDFVVDMAKIEDAARRKVKGDMVNFDFVGDIKMESVKEGGPGSGPQLGDKRGTYKTGHKKSVMKPGAGKRPGSAPDGGQTDDEADQYDTEMGEADLTKSQIKKVHKVADELPKDSFRDRYGKKQGDSVRYATATKMVKKKLGIKEDRRLYVETIAGLKKKAEKSGMPYSILKKVYDRGMAAWKGGHRPGATQQQWAFARVNSFVTKSSGTWGGADKDLAAKVRGSK